MRITANIFPFCFQSISSEGQPKQPEDICSVAVPHAENQTLSDLTCEYNLLFGYTMFFLLIFQNYLHILTRMFSKSSISRVCMCASSTAGGRWRRVIPQSGRRPHAVHWLDPAGGVLPAKPRGVALQAQTPLCPDHPVNKGPQETPEGPHAP